MTKSIMLKTLLALFLTGFSIISFIIFALTMNFYILLLNTASSIFLDVIFSSKDIVEFLDGKEGDYLSDDWYVSMVWLIRLIWLSVYLVAIILIPLNFIGGIILVIIVEFTFSQVKGTLRDIARDKRNI